MAGSSGLSVLKKLKSDREELKAGSQWPLLEFTPPYKLENSRSNGLPLGEAPSEGLFSEDTLL